jgi:hypothetical protein
MFNFAGITCGAFPAGVHGAKRDDICLVASMDQALGMVLALAYVTTEGAGISWSAELLAMFTGPVELPKVVLVLRHGRGSP